MNERKKEIRREREKQTISQAMICEIRYQIHNLSKTKLCFNRKKHERHTSLSPLLTLCSSTDVLEMCDLCYLTFIWLFICTGTAVSVLHWSLSLSMFMQFIIDCSLQ